MLAYRMMLQEDGRSITINVEAGTHGRAQYERWFAKADGYDPLLLMAAH
jgi:hypothetical protein